MSFYPAKGGGKDSDIELIGVFPANKTYYEVGAGYKHSYTFTKNYSQVIAVANKSSASQSITATGATLQDYTGSFENNFDRGCTAKLWRMSLREQSFHGTQHGTAQTWGHSPLWHFLGRSKLWRFIDALPVGGGINSI